MFTAVTNLLSTSVKEAKLGKGTFGKVYRYRMADGRRCAFKVSAFDERRHKNKHSKKYGYQTDFINECDILNKFRGCPNIVNLEGVFFHPSGKCYLVLELMEIPLLEWFSSTSYATRMQYLPSIIQQVSSGLATLHSNGYIHNDFKDDNVLLSFKSGPPPFPPLSSSLSSSSSQQSSSLQQSSPFDLTSYVYTDIGTTVVAKICDFGKSCICCNESRYHGIESFTPPYPVNTFYDQEKWSFAVSMTNVILGRKICHEDNKIFVYNRYLDHIGFNIELYLRNNLSASDFALIPNIYWSTVLPIFRNKCNSIPDLVCTYNINNNNVYDGGSNDNNNYSSYSSSNSSGYDDDHQFNINLLTIKRRKVGYEEYKHGGIYMRTLASYIAMKLKRKLTDKELEAIFLIFTGGKAGRLFFLESETEVYEYQAKLLHVTGYQYIIMPV